MLPDAQNGDLQVHRRAGGRHQPVCTGGGQRPHRHSRSHRRQTARGHPQLDDTGSGVLSEITGNLNAERYTFQQPAGRPVTTRRSAWTTTCAREHRLSGTYYRQKFTDTSFDTTNSRAAHLAGIPALRHAGLVPRGVHRDAPIDAQPEPRERSARGLLGSTGRTSGPYHNPAMYTGSLANQGGFALGISAAVGITNAGPAFTPSARNATTLTVADTVNWLKGSHSIGLGGEFGQYDVWLATLGSHGGAVDRVRHADRRPGAGDVHARRTSRAAAQAIATTPRRSTRCSPARVTQYRRDGAARRQHGPVRLPGRQPRGRPAAAVRLVHPGQLASPAEPVDQPRRSLRIADAVLRDEQQLLDRDARRRSGASPATCRAAT